MNPSLSFINKNMFRRYPLRKSSSCLSAEGVTLPNELLVSAKLFSAYDEHEVYIAKIWCQGKQISVHLREAFNDTDIGYVNGKLTTDFQTLYVTPISKEAGGSITFGPIKSLEEIQGTNTFSPESTMFEGTVVVPRIAPGVSHIQIKKGQPVTGRVKLILSNLTATPGDEILNLSIPKPYLLRTSSDQNLDTGMCSYDPLTTINGVTPDDNGNIDIYGIDPVRIETSAIGIKVNTQGLALSDLCAGNKNNVPATPVNKNTYPSFMAIGEEEWRNWSQYA